MKVKLYDVTIIKHENRINIGLMFKDRQGSLHSVDLGIYEDKEKNGFAEKTLNELSYPYQDLTIENLKRLDVPLQDSDLDTNSEYNLSSDKFNQLSVIKKIRM